MKRILLLSGLLIILFAACKKQTFNDTRQATIDDLKIQAFLKANKSTIGDFIKDPSGLYYQIITPNPGAHPVDTNQVKITVTGRLLNGTEFQTKGTFTDSLSTFVKGIQIGVPLIGTNGVAPFARIRLIMPSALGYGSVEQNGNVTIPANSVLDFTVDLQGFF
jgi:FKBP-type peptidyl-prolyl cis-trans isomerase FkpA